MTAYASQRLRTVGGGEAPGPGWTTVAEARANADGHVLVVATAVADDVAEARLWVPASKVGSEGFVWRGFTNNLQVGPAANSGVIAAVGDLVQLQMRPLGGQRRCWLVSGQMTVSEQRIEAIEGFSDIVILAEPVSVTAASGETVQVTATADRVVDWIVEMEAGNGALVVEEGTGSSVSVDVVVTDDVRRYRVRMSTPDGSQATTNWMSAIPSSTSVPLAWVSTPADQTVAQGSVGPTWQYGGGTGTYQAVIDYGNGRRHPINMGALKSVTSTNFFSQSATTTTVTIYDGVSTITDSASITVTAAASGQPTFSSTPAGTVTHVAGAPGSLTWVGATGTYSYAKLSRGGEQLTFSALNGTATPMLTAQLDGLAPGEYVFRAELVNSLGLGSYDLVTVTVAAESAGATLKTMTATTSGSSDPVAIPSGAVAGDLVLAIATNRGDPQDKLTMTAPVLDGRSTLADVTGSSYSPSIIAWLGRLPSPLPANLTFGGSGSGTGQQALILVEGRSGFVVSSPTGGGGTSATFAAAAPAADDATVLAVVASLGPDLGVTASPSGYTGLVDEVAATWLGLSVHTDTGVDTPATPGTATLVGGNNWTTLTIACLPEGGEVVPPEDGATYGKPDAPDLSTSGAVLVSTWSQLVTASAAASTGATFLLSNTTFTVTSTLVPKQGQRFIGQGSTILDLSGIQPRAFRGPAHDVLIARMKIRNPGGGVAKQQIGMIDATGTDWVEGSLSVAHDWRIHDVTLEGSVGANCGIMMGHRFIVDECDIRGFAPHGLGGSYGTGGVVWGCYFKDNGTIGGSGVGVNNAQIKMHWWNVGPWGDTDHDTSRFRSYSSAATPPAFTSAQHNYETPEPFLLAHCVFDEERSAAFGGGAYGRSVWFDIDCRDMEVAYCTFIKPRVGVFFEGCNGGHVHHNTFDRHANANFTSVSFANTGGVWPSKYWGSSAVALDCSDNILVEDNIFEDCPNGCVINFHSTRGRTGADWVTPIANGGWPLATSTFNFMIRNSYAPIAVGDASTVGSSNITIQNNELRGTSIGLGHAYNSEVDRATETNHGTMVIEGNSYPTAFRNFWNGVRYDSLAAWQAATGFDTP